MANELQKYNPQQTGIDLPAMADAFYSSGLFPDIKSQAQAIVKIQAGAELGIPPIYSMQKVYIVQGKIVLAAEAMGAMVKRSGKYNYTVTRYDDTAVSLQFTDKGKDVFLSTFTIEDARKAGLIKPGSGWEKFPRAMLMSKALSQGARIVCPEVIGGAYTVEDFGMEVDDEGIVQQPPKVMVVKETGEIVQQETAGVRLPKEILAKMQAAVDNAEELFPENPPAIAQTSQDGQGTLLPPKPVQSNGGNGATDKQIEYFYSFKKRMGDKFPEQYSVLDPATKSKADMVSVLNELSKIK